MKGLRWVLAAVVSAGMFGQAGGVLHAAGPAIIDFDRGSYLLSDVQYGSRMLTTEDINSLISI